MDQGVKESDILLAELEKQLKGEYSRAASETREKLKDYLEKYEVKNKIKLQQLAKKEITKAEYTYWRTGQIMIGKRWAEMADTLAQDFTNVDKIARSAVHGHMADVYALNHNYAAFEIEKQSLVDTSYSLYNRQTVEKLWRENPKLLPDPAEGSPTEKMLRENADLRWNRDHIQSELVQGILQGESVQQMAKRMENVAGMDSRAAIRNARTMNTMALNAGRLDQMRAAAALGLHVQKEWRATLDDRTRASHIDLDGEVKEIDEPFSNKLMYPGDPDGDGSEVYNCRCYLRQHSDKAKASDLGLRNLDHMSQTTYDEWKESKMSEEKKQKRREAIAAAQKPKVDLIGKTAGRFTETQIEEIRKRLENAPEGIRNAWQECVENGYFLEPEESTGTAQYQAGSNRVQLNTKKVAKGDDLNTPYETYFHEYGHNMDYMLNHRDGGYLSWYRGITEQVVSTSTGESLSQIVNREALSAIVKNIDEDARYDIISHFIDGNIMHDSLSTELSNLIKKYRTTNGLSASSPIIKELTKKKNEAMKVFRKDILDTSYNAVWDFVWNNSDKFLPEMVTKEDVLSALRNIKSEYGYDYHAIGNMSDMLNYMTLKKYGIGMPLGVGHRNSYWDSINRVGKETFAEVTASYCANDKSLKVLEKYFPDTLKFYNDILEGNYERK